MLLSIALMASTLHVCAMEGPKKGVHPLQAKFAMHRDDIQNELTGAYEKLEDYNRANKNTLEFRQETIYKYDGKITQALIGVNNAEKDLSRFVDTYITPELEPEAQKLYLNRANELFAKLSDAKQKLTNALNDIKQREEAWRTERSTNPNLNIRLMQ